MESPESHAPNNWGLRPLVTMAMPEGTALIGNFEGARLRVRENATMDASQEHSDLFIRNQFVFRAEERIGLEVRRPSAFLALTGM